MAKLLVTGSLGTIGRPLVQELAARGHEVWETDIQHHSGERFIRADVGSYRQLERVFEQDYDFVFHLAAEVGRTNGEEYYELLWQTNAVGTRNILEWQRKRGFKLIFFSSSEIYGEAPFAYLAEDLTDRHPVFPMNDYAITKWVNELQVRHFERRHQVPVMRLRLFNPYGPGEYYNPYRGVVCLFIYRALHQIPYQVYDGYFRAFLYIDDMVAPLANAVDRFTPGEVYNIGGQEFRSVLELSNEVIKHTGADPALVQLLPAAAHQATNKRPDLTKAVRDLGLQPRVTLEQGIPRTVAWMRTVYNR